MAASKAVQTATKKQRIAKERKAYATHIRTQWSNALNSIITVGKFLREAADDYNAKRSGYRPLFVVILLLAFAVSGCDDAKREREKFIEICKINIGEGAKIWCPCIYDLAKKEDFINIIKPLMEHPIADLEPALQMGLIGLSFQCLNTYPFGYGKDSIFRKR